MSVKRARLTMEAQKVEAVANKDDESINHYSITDLHIQTNFKIVHDFSEPFDGDYTKIDDLRFIDCTFDEFPRAQILLDFIPHLSSLCLGDCELTKITREDLRGLEALKELWLNGNMIKKLPKGLFEYTPNLEKVSFYDNEVEEIDADILDPLCNLKFFDLNDNVAINVKFDIENEDESVTLEDLKAEIRKCDPIEKLKDEIQAVKQENAQLKQQIEDSNKKVEAVNVQMKKGLAELNEKVNNQKAEIEELKLQLVVSNFTVIVNEKEFRVNKKLLKDNSPMLAKYIDENDEAETLEVTDISTGTFEEVLKFMRTKIQPDENANLLELYAASGKLEMKELMDITAEVLMQKVNAQNAFDVMKLCQKFAHDKLNKKAFEEYKKNFE